MIIMAVFISGVTSSAFAEEAKKPAAKIHKMADQSNKEAAKSTKRARHQKTHALKNAKDVVK